MPTIYSYDGFRFFFYSNEHEPIHIHVEKDNGVIKINLENLEIAQSINFKKKDIRRVLEITTQKQKEFMEAWNEYFKK